MSNPAAQPHPAPTAPVSGRVCGGCTMCCKAVAVVELQKPTGQWCVHTLSAGCGVYPARLTDPHYAECNGYTCIWLQGHLTENDRPDRIQVVFTAMTNPDPAAPRPLIVANEATIGAAEGKTRGAHIVRAFVKSGFSVLVKNPSYATEYTSGGTIVRRPIDSSDPMRVALDPKAPMVVLTVGGRPA